jgi:Na+-transporting methylmalonyl-CoA/oxaloacetate decarboxylase gamma subunit
MNSFWDWFWLLVWTFVFVMYLMVLFQILTDLFRDKDVNGWVKALWVIGLIVFPFLVALIYLIVRGRGMAERQMKDYEAARQSTESYIKSVAQESKTPADQIAAAKSLLDSGAISQAEYDQLKAKALA